MSTRPVIPLELDDVPEPAHDCHADHSLVSIPSKAATTDWQIPGSYQAYVVYKCKECNDVWGCREQWDSGTGSDDHWKRFGEIDPDDVKRHY